MTRGAQIVGDYRYHLWRWWGVGPSVTFVMLNPSTADGTGDDPTLLRCIALAKSWGCGGLEVANLFAYRTSSPAELRQLFERGSDVVGSKNNHWITHATRNRVAVICAWGIEAAHYRDRVRDVLALLPTSNNTYALALSRGHPRHPLARGKSFIPPDCIPFRWPDA